MWRQRRGRCGCEGRPAEPPNCPLCPGSGGSGRSGQCSSGDAVFTGWGPPGMPSRGRSDQLGLGGSRQASTGCPSRGWRGAPHQCIANGQRSSARFTGSCACPSAFGSRPPAQGRRAGRQAGSIGHTKEEMRHRGGRSLLAGAACMLLAELSLTATDVPNSRLCSLVPGVMVLASCHTCARHARRQGGGGSPSAACPRRVRQGNGHTQRRAGGRADAAGEPC